ncbi:oligosaccharide flippase family protein [Jiangella mangrovi]|uniref:PST family polysaccharide transporter n=1 Tax=Jiangella mangrovi TaxID=1524084 RepID=A0A7W9GM60_9ACTN|nr:oligosaccharide flippase family protein [Jiangella mangrovi]MBB5786226.1 PST family polysaccharide transporter [Jiangella mangrovi]
MSTADTLTSLPVIREENEHHVESGRTTRVIRGLSWTLGSQLFSRGVNVLMGIVLARILVPEDYGVFGLAILVVNILIGINDVGMTMAVVRWTGDIRTAARTAVTLSVLFSLGLYALVYAGAPAYAAYMNAPDATAMLRVLALVLVLDGVTAVPSAILIREFQQPRLARAELVTLPIGVGVTLAFAFAGAGGWSLVAGQLVGNVTMAIALVVLAGQWLRPGFDAAAARSMIVFSLPLAMTSLIEYVLLNADYFIVGRVLGTLSLGFYVLAFNVSSWPVTAVTQSIRRVSISEFASMQDSPGQLDKAFRAGFVVLVKVMLPLVMGLSLLSGPFLRLVFGHQWAPAAPVLAWLAVLGGVRVAQGLVFDVLVAVGRSMATLVVKLVWLAALVPALVAAAHYGDIKTVAMAHAAVAVLVSLPMFLLASRLVGVRLSALWPQLVRPAVAGVCAGVAATLVQLVAGSDLMRLLAGGAVLLFVYTAIAFPGLMWTWPADAGRHRRRRRRTRRAGHR